MPFSPIPAVLAALQKGEMVILVDDEDRENEGDLVMAAQFADAKSIAFMATKACGLICVAMDGTLLDRLGLPLMTSQNGSRFGTAFTMSIEARVGVTTGISAADRARTIQAAIAEDARPQDIVTPGHVFPLRARDGGVPFHILRRAKEGARVGAAIRLALFWGDRRGSVDAARRGDVLQTESSGIGECRGIVPTRAGARVSYELIAA